MKETILKIPEDKFTVDVERSFLSNLIERAIEKAGGTGNLSKILIEKYKLNKYPGRGLADNLRKWQRMKYRPFMNYYLGIGSYCNIKRKTLYSKIKSIKLPRGKLPIKTIYPLKLDGAWAFVSECIKVEGNLSKKKKRITLENTDMGLIQRFKKYIKKIGVSNFRQDLRVRAMVPSDNKLSEVKVINLKTNEEKRIYERILKLKKGDKKEVIFTENHVDVGSSFDYLIKLKSTQFKVHVHIPSNRKIEATSTLKTNLSYQKVTPSFIIIIGNSTLHYLLNKNFQIQAGNKSHKIFIPGIIKQLSKNILREVINAVLAAESTVVIKDKKISISSLSKKYIKDFQELLLKFNITSFISGKQKTLTICGYKNFEKVNKHFDFILKNKKRDLSILLKNRIIDQSPKRLSKSLYLKSLSELGVATLIEIRNNANRSGHSFRQYTKELIDKEYIEIAESNWPKKYRITNSGKEYLNKNKTYWLD